MRGTIDTSAHWNGVVCRHVRTQFSRRYAWCMPNHKSSSLALYIKYIYLYLNLYSYSCTLSFSTGMRSHMCRNAHKPHWRTRDTRTHTYSISSASSRIMSGDVMTKLHTHTINNSFLFLSLSLSFYAAFLLFSTSVVSATLCCAIMSQFTITITRHTIEREIDPDNVIGAIASSSGDCVAILMYLASCVCVCICVCWCVCLCVVIYFFPLSVNEVRAVVSACVFFLILLSLLLLFLLSPPLH